MVYTYICYAATKQVFSDALDGPSEMITVIMQDVDKYMTEDIAKQIRLQVNKP